MMPGSAAYDSACFTAKLRKKTKAVVLGGTQMWDPNSPKTHLPKVRSVTSVTRLAANSKWETEMYHMHECNVLDIPNLNAGLLDQAKTSDSWYASPLSRLNRHWSRTAWVLGQVSGAGGMKLYSCCPICQCRHGECAGSGLRSWLLKSCAGLARRPRRIPGEGKTCVSRHEINQKS